MGAVQAGCVWLQDRHTGCRLCYMLFTGRAHGAVAGEAGVGDAQSVQAMSSSSVQAPWLAEVAATAARNRLLTQQLTGPRRSTREASRCRVAVGAAHAPLVAAAAAAAAANAAAAAATAAAAAAPGTAPVLALVLPREPILERVFARLYESLEGSVDQHLIRVGVGVGIGVGVGVRVGVRVG